MDLIRDTFKRGKYQDAVLPLTVLRRLVCVLADKKERMLGKQAELRGRKLENLDPQLRKIAGLNHPRLIGDSTLSGGWSHRSSSRMLSGDP